jgi:hypothetical protein
MQKHWEEPTCTVVFLVFSPSSLLSLSLSLSRFKEFVIYFEFLPSLISGVSDYLAENEHHAIYLAREIVKTLNWKKLQPFPPTHLVPKVDPPLYDPGLKLL